MSKVIQFDRNGETGNIFYILGQARKVLLEQGRGNDGIEMFERVKQGDYENALKVIGKYVELQDITYKPRYQPRTYELLLKYCKDSQIRESDILSLLRYYTDTLGWGMHAEFLQNIFLFIHIFYVFNLHFPFSVIFLHQ